MNLMRVDWYLALAFSFGASTVVAPAAARAQASSLSPSTLIRPASGCYQLQWHLPAGSKDSTAFAACLPNSHHRVSRSQLHSKVTQCSPSGSGRDHECQRRGRHPRTATHSPSLGRRDSMASSSSWLFEATVWSANARPFSDEHVRG